MPDLPPPLVGVVIPCYNYASTVTTAINSVKSQTLNNLRCTIVDDGSTDNTKEVVLSAIKGDRRFSYIYKDNGGVATARNRGVFSEELGRPIYVCCLDADDQIAPEFLEVCVSEMEKDPSISIAYTGLWYIRPDGKEGLSPWPDKFNYDSQLEGRNQIPTCCVTKFEVWERLGGQRQRYAPYGAGEEDAEFWLRAGAYGFNAKKVTDAGFFIYSWMSGRVSGNRNHKVTDYRIYHPWVNDKNYPFASLATPTRLSHPVRQYDEPVVSIIIPVGPGHEKLVIDALDSLESQTFRRWEVIVVDDTRDAGSASLQNTIYKSYPYARYVVGGKRGGAGAARNFGAEYARSPFLVFLDADDYLLPEAIERLLMAWDSSQAIIYTDHLGKAIMTEKEANDLGDRLIDYNQRSQSAIFKHGWKAYDCEKAVRQPDQDMYHWCLVTTLIPRAWHKEIGGFDETMKSWEDWEYYIRMARAGKCFTRLGEPLVVYRYYTGERRESGIKDYQNLIKYMQEKFHGGQQMPCGCKEQPSVLPSVPQRQMQSASQSQQGGIGTMNDNQFRLIAYDHPNRGMHKVTGASTGISYGYRAFGDKFLVHIDDIRVQPHIFKEIEVVSPVKHERFPTPPPQDIQEKPVDKFQGETSQPVPETVASSLSSPETSQDLLEANAIKALTEIPGITTSLALSLIDDGITSARDVVDLGVNGLADRYQGVGERQAKVIFDGAMLKTGMAP